MGTLSLTDLAERDLSDIWTFIAGDNPTAADRLLDLLDERSRLLADFPEIGPSREDLGPGFRYFVVGSYLILYRRVGTGVEVVRYMHGSRDLLRALGA